MKRILLEQLLQSHTRATYEQQYQYIVELIKKEKIRPVKASGTNGKKPALYRAYWVMEEKKDYGVYEEELKYHLHPAIKVDYYLSHFSQYEEDRSYVLRLDSYLKKNRERLKVPVSVNERSFEIWNREKFLTREQGKRILKRCGIEFSFLNTYHTTEPLACYSHVRQVPQNILILENKDTFYSMRRHLLEGRGPVLGEEIGTLIYGGGKRVLRSFQDFDFCMEPYMADSCNHIFYFGDLDYEGIGIYENLSEAFYPRWEIRPFLAAYCAMLGKAEEAESLPKTKEKQNRNISQSFFSYFSRETADKMKEILCQGYYIPQEILNLADLQGDGWHHAV